MKATLSLVRDDHEAGGDIDDRALAQGLIDRSESALAEIYRRNSAPVFGLAKRLLRDEALAEEVVQEVFLRLWNRPERYQPDRGSLRSFLLSHTHGRSIDLIRAESSRRRREEREAWMTAEAGPSIDEEVWQMALADKVRTALTSLPEREREAIELAYFGGLTYREVASRLNTPEGTVKSRIRAGMQRLQTTMTAAGVGLA